MSCGCAGLQMARIAPEWRQEANGTRLRYTPISRVIKQRASGEGGAMARACVSGARGAFGF